jgi:hypothetical protein
MHSPQDQLASTPWIFIYEVVLGVGIVYATAVK